MDPYTPRHLFLIIFGLLMRETLFSLLASLFILSNATAQHTKVCSCIQLFCEALEEIEPVPNEDNSDLIFSIYENLKRDSPDFNTCSDFYTLDLGSWSTGKLRLALQFNQCSISEEARNMLNQGPIIYEMSADLEKQIKTQHEQTEFELLDDQEMIAQVQSMALDFLKASYSNRKDDYFNYLPDWYIRFFGEEELRNTQLARVRGRDSLDAKISFPPARKIDQFLKEGDTLTSLIRFNASFELKDQKGEIPMTVLAISLDNAETWKFADVTDQKLRAFWVLNHSIDPIGLKAKLNKEESIDFPAQNNDELGAHFCKCSQNTTEEDYLGKLKCSGIVLNHPIYKGLDTLREIHQYVKKHCKEQENAMLFMGLPP